MIVMINMSLECVRCKYLCLTIHSQTLRSNCALFHSASTKYPYLCIGADIHGNCRSYFLGISFKYSPTVTDDEISHVRCIDSCFHTRYLLARQVPVPPWTCVGRWPMQRRISKALK